MRFVDVEAMCLQFLAPRVSVPVVTVVPEDRPAEFIRLWRNGGPARNRVLDAPLVTVEGWSSDSVEASDLTRTARELFFNEYTAMPLVRRVSEISGQYSVPDPESETPRYRFTIQLLVRAHR